MLKASFKCHIFNKITISSKLCIILFMFLKAFLFDTGICQFCGNIQFSFIDSLDFPIFKKTLNLLSNLSNKIE